MSAPSAPSHLLARLEWPGSARHLAVLRAVLGAYLVSVFSSGVIPLLLAIPAEVYPGTRSSFPLAFEVFAAQHLVQPMLAIGIAGSLCLLLGLLTRVAVWVTLIAYLITQNFYYRMLTAHDDWVYFTFYLLVLGFAPCADAWSIDARLRKPKARPAQHYRWPVELMGAWLAIVYCAAGIAKLFPLRKAIVWLNGRSLQGMVTNEIHESISYWLLGHSLFDYSIRWPFFAMSGAGALVELSVISVLFSRKPVPWMIAAVIGLHSSIAMLGITGFLTMFSIGAIAWLDPTWFEPRRPTAS